MPDPLTIIVNDIELDLFEGTEDNFYVTEQIHDLRSLQTRNASFSKTLTAPYTENNKTALKDSLPVLNGQVQSITKVSAQILFKGVPFVTNAEAAGSVRSDNAFTITFFYKNFDFFDKIRGILVAELQWSDLDFDFDGPGYLTNSTKTVDVVTALNQWFNSVNLDKEVQSGSTTRQEHDLNFSGFFIYLKTIARRIVEQAGFTFDESDMLNEVNYNTLALACPVQKFSDLRDIAAPLFAIVTNNAPQVFAAGEGRIVFQVTTGDPAGVWNVGLSEWQFTTTNNINVTLSISGTNVEGGGNQENQIRIFKNGIIILTQRLTGLSTFDFDLLVGTSVVSGDTIHATIFINRNADITVDSGGSFLVSEEGANFQRDIIIAEWIPNITLIEFMQSLAAKFNAVIDTDEATNTVILKPYNDILTSEEQDLTANFDTSVEIERLYSLPYFRRNFFKYADTEARRSDTTGVHVFPDELLDSSGVLVELIFGDSDNSNFISFLYTARTFPVMETPAFELEHILDEPTTTITVTTAAPNTFTFTLPVEFEVGDYVELTVNTPQGNREVNRIAQKTASTTGSCFNNWGNVSAGLNFLIYRFGSINLNTPRIANMIASQGTYAVFFDGNDTVTSITAGLEARFDDTMLFGQLLTEHYDTLLTALDTPFTLRARFHFTPTEFQQISLSKTVYLGNFNTRFVINKIEQYKVNGFCRMELVRV